MWAFLSSAIGPLAIRALVAIGFASVSFAGVTAAFGGLQSYAQSSWAALPVSVLQLATLCGVPQALGMVFGAMSARIGLWAAANGSKLIFKG
ncbi:MAG: DUF2523 domain-containing protein [Betaproteobacteria bacterium]|nr:DUF2523 domain-containing protein [Betaproteobacteria bacterium]